MAEHWTFRGDKQLDPILRIWTEQNEKSFHVRQALRQYVALQKHFYVNATMVIPELRKAVNAEKSMGSDET